MQSIRTLLACTLLSLATLAATSCGGGSDSDDGSPSGTDLAFSTEVLFAPDGTTDVTVDVFGSLALVSLIEVEVLHPDGEVIVEREGTRFSFHGLPTTGIADVRVCLLGSSLCVQSSVDLAAGVAALDPNCDPRDFVDQVDVDLGLPPIAELGSVRNVRFESDRLSVDADVEEIVVVVRPPLASGIGEFELVLLDDLGREVTLDAPGLWSFEPQIFLAIDCVSPPVTATLRLDEVLVDVE